MTTAERISPLQRPQTAEERMSRALAVRGYTAPPDCPVCRSNEHVMPISVVMVAGTWHCDACFKTFSDQGSI
jgi:ribosomal protein L37AE/L43A